MGISSALGSQALVPAGFGFRNLIINGDFRINQRGFTSTTTDQTYGFDRWVLAKSGGGTTTYSAQTFTLGSGVEPGYEAQNFARIVTTGQSASGDYSTLSQRIEDVRNCAGATASVSFWARASSGTPKVAVELAQNFGSGGSPSAAVNNYVGQATLSTSWQRFTFTVVVPTISGKTLGTDANSSSLRLNLWVSAGSDYNSRTGSLGIQSGTFDFWGIQVEANNVPTSFEHRPFVIELHLCQRYYTRFRGNESGFVPVGAGMYQGANECRAVYHPPVSFRVAPSLAFANLVVNSGGAAQQVSGLVAIYSDGDLGAIYLSFSTVQSGTVGHGAVPRIANDASGYFEMDAEL